MQNGNLNLFHAAAVGVPLTALGFHLKSGKPVPGYVCTGLIVVGLLVIAFHGYLFFLKQHSNPASLPGYSMLMDWGLLKSEGMTPHLRRV